MSKIIVDQIQKSGGAALTLPTSDGASGDIMVTDGSGALSFASGATSVQVSKYSKAFAVTGSTYNATNKIMWTDVLAGVSTDDILIVKIHGRMNATTNFQTRIIGVDASGSAITTGYLGAGYNDYYEGNNETNSTTSNSNGGWLQFPGYTNAYGTNSDSYGNGMLFEYEGCPHKYGTTGGHHHRIRTTYQQNTSYTNPNFSDMAWGSYGSSAPPDTWHGVMVYPSGGSWDTTYNNNIVTVELITKNA
jgi:hypothetical protein